MSQTLKWFRSLVNILVSNIHLLPELLRRLHPHCEQEKHLIDPGHDALSLVAAELWHALLLGDVVDGEDEFPALEVEAEGEVGGEGRDKGFLETLNKLLM